MRVADKVELNDRSKRQLQALLRREDISRRVWQRASAILLAAEGWQNKEIAVKVHLDRRQVSVWRQRFITDGAQALMRDAARPPRTMKLSTDDQLRILDATLEERPPSGRYWTARTLSKRLGIKAGAIERFWRRDGLKPHLRRTFELAPEARIDPDKVQLVGFFMHAAKKAIVFSCDEKGLGRKTTCKESGLPLKRGRAPTMANYYKLNGTLPIFSALEALVGRSAVLTNLPPLTDWLTFLEAIDRVTPPGLQLYLIEDSSSDFVARDLQGWLLRHTRLVLHVTPTRKSWLRLFELFYRDIFEQRTRPEVNALERSVTRYVAKGDRSADTVVWPHKKVSPQEQTAS